MTVQTWRDQNASCLRRLAAAMKELEATKAKLSETEAALEDAESRAEANPFSEDSANAMEYENVCEAIEDHRRGILTTDELYEKTVGR